MLIKCAFVGHKKLWYLSKCTVLQQQKKTKFGIWEFFESPSRIQFSSKSVKNIGYFRWRPTYIMYHWILLVMRNVSDKICDENLNINYMLNNFFPKIMPLWNNVEEYGSVRGATSHNIIRRTRIAWWIAKATNTHTEYVILTPFPRQQWLRERASMLRYTSIVLHCS
jgi:hypothetical protein